MTQDAPVFLLPDPATRRWLAPMTDDPVLWTADQAARIELLALALGILVLALVAALGVLWVMERSQRRRAERALAARPFVVVRG